MAKDKRREREKQRQRQTDRQTQTPTQKQRGDRDRQTDFRSSKYKKLFARTCCVKVLPSESTWLFSKGIRSEAWLDSEEHVFSDVRLPAGAERT